MQEMQETWIPSLGQEGPLEKWMETQSSILSWQRSVADYGPGGHRKLDMTELLVMHTNVFKLNFHNLKVYF